VDHDAFLDGAGRIMARGTELLPGATSIGTPQRSGGPRPFGTLSYLALSYSVAGPPARLATITASAAQRTDGRPNTGVISLSVRSP
jgi:hypothetical protein